MNILNEATRNDLVTKGKKGANYSASNQKKGKNRYQRRRYSKIPTQVKSFNDIDMNSFFKKDILTVGIQVTGETNDYVVKIKFGGILNEIQHMIKSNNNKLEFKTILISLTRVFNTGDVYIHCSCPDYQYRFAYWSTKNNYESGQPENRPANITNPNDTKGSGCKHILLVLANIDWMMKIASVINNYIHYAEENMPRAFADIIFPALYGMNYKKAIQLNLFEPDDIESPESLIDIINDYGRKRTQYKKEPQQSVNPRFVHPKKEPEVVKDNRPTLFDTQNDEEQEPNVPEEEQNISISDLKDEDNQNNDKE